MKNILLIITIFLSSITLQAQDGATKKEKIQALKIAFITQKLELTSDEAQKFWPVYNRYDAEIKQTIMDNRGGDAIDKEEKILNIRKKYRTEFTKVLGQPKTNKFFNTEREFRGVLMRNLKNRQGEERPWNRRKSQ